MKLNKIKTLLLFLILGSTLLLNSCGNENFGDDYNKNTYGIYSADYKSLMSGAIAQFASRGGSNFLMKPNLYVQYQSQVVYTSESLYAEEGGQWDWYYVRALNNLDEIIKAYSGEVTNEMLLQGSKNNMIGTSKILRAIIYKRITDTYGDIPYSEANKIYEGIKTPKFDKQEQIYTSLLAELKAGRDMLNSSETAPAGDILYNKDVNKWKKLANSVILQASLQLSKKYPSATGPAATAFKEALGNSAGVIETVADEAWFTYNADAAVQNPFYAFRAADYRLSAELIESLKGSTSTFNVTSNHTADARRSVYATNSDPGLPYGYNKDDLATAGYTTSNKAQISTKYRSITSPLSLMTAAYTFLNRAEAATLGWTAEVPETLLAQAITLNYASLDSKYGTAISPSAAGYAAARVLDMATFGKARVIGEEKWVTLFANGFDAWSEFRRTGYPALKPAHSSLNGGSIPRRIAYPRTEQIFNATNYAVGVSTLSSPVDLNTSKVWWDQ